MTEKELLEIEEFFIEKGEKTIVKLGGVGFVIVGTLIYLPFFRQSIFSAILVGIYFFCYIIALGVKFYYRFKYSEAYKMRSEIERKDWHYLYTKKHWKIRSINVKFGYSICIQLVGVLALFLGLKEVPVSILYAVLIPLITSIGVFVITFILIFSPYMASRKERKRLDREFDEKWAV